MDPVVDLAGIDDHDLLAGGVADGVAEARASGRRWARLVEFHRRRESDFRARQAVSGHHTLTPRQETAVEVAELWGLPEKRVRHELNVALFLSASFGRVWELCQAGQLDSYRATVIADTVRHAVTDPVELARLADRLAAFLDKHLTDRHGLAGVPPVVGCTVKQLRNKLTYELTRLRPADAEERHRRAHAERRVRAVEFEDGMAQLGITSTIDQVRLAEHRLTLAAKQLRAEGDTRTLEQLRSDLAIDLLVGRAEGVPTPRYARPIIMATVPIQTLMGVSDEPGTLSGGAVIPASLCRAIASQPDATWYRMLTDPAGRTVELSTTSYRPTPPIWRHVVAEWGTCFQPTCTVPATEAELDHRRPWPEGPTSTSELRPACKTGHTAKHAPGFGIEQDETGSFVFVTGAGFRHPVTPAAHPASEEWPELPDIQCTGTELLQALTEIRDRRDMERAEARELEWEHGTRLEGLMV